MPLYFACPPDPGLAGRPFGPGREGAVPYSADPNPSVLPSDERLGGGALPGGGRREDQPGRMVRGGEGRALRCAEAYSGRDEKPGGNPIGRREGFSPNRGR